MVKHFSRLFLVIVTTALHMAAAPAVTATEAISSKICVACHQEMYDRQSRHEYQHHPFVARQCITCHLSDIASPTEVLDGKAEFPDRIKWLVKDYTAATDHWLVIPADGINTTLYIEAEQNDTPPHRNRISVPPLATLPHPEDREPPSISALAVTAMEPGLYYNATITWKTDEPADSKMEITAPDNRTRTVDSSQYTMEHRLTAVSLRPNQPYRIQAISRDRFGNESVSEPLIITTVASNAAAAADPVGRNTDRTEDLTLNAELTAGDDAYLLTIRANSPVTLSVGTEHGVLSGNRGTMSNLPPTHQPLRNQYETNTIVCAVCHQKYQASFSHPINVLPKPGMVFPPEYRTLPNGRMSCMTCHHHHASDNEARMVRPSKRELCIGCHHEFS